MALPISLLSRTGLPRRCSLAALAISAFLLAAEARAVLLAGSNGNTSAPADDPGFADVGTSSTGGASVTYLGNGWCITANHVTLSNSFTHLAVNGIPFQFTQTVHSPFGSADLVLFQINGDPGLAAPLIATSTPAAGSTVTMIGNGASAGSQQYWNVTAPATGTWSWSPTSAGPVTNPIPANTYWTTGAVPAGTYQASGYSLGSPTIRWGQNLITRTSITDGNTQYFYTTFNDPSYSPGQSTLSSEAQAVNGDSGGAVFFKSGANWQLAGIMFAQGGFPGQEQPSPSSPYTQGVFGDITAIADLSVYRNTIESVITPMSWTGQSSSTWDTTSTSWASWNPITKVVAASNSGGTYYAATFGDKNPLTNATVANANISIQAAGVAPPSVVFNNSTAVSYSFSNAGGGTTGIADSASGPTSVIKNGNGTVTLLSANSFTGPVYLNAGRLNIRNSAALGASSGVTVASGASLELQSSSSTVTIGSTIPLTIFGAGLAANPTGALNNVAGNNTYGGNVIIGAGGATINSATSGQTLTIGGSVNLGTSALTISGAGNASIAGALWGNGSLVKSGNGILFLSGANTYTGDTTVTGGTVITGSLGGSTGAVTVSATSSGTSTLLLGPNQSQTASSLSGSVANGGSAIVSIGSQDTFAVNQSTNTVFAGAIQNSGNFVKLGAGTLEIDGAPTWYNNSSIQVSGGTLKFNVTSGSTGVGSGVTAMVVSSGGSLQLAGSVSALATASNQVNITNDSQAAAGGINVTGTNQRAGAINGAGNTVIAAGSDFTANSVIQNSLVIGGSAGNPGKLTIQASSQSGAPLGNDGASTFDVDTSPLASLGAALSNNSLAALNVDGASLIAAPGGQPLTIAAAGISSPLAGSPSPAGVLQTPEPSSLLLAALGVATYVAFRRHRANRRILS